MKLLTCRSALVLPLALAAGHALASAAHAEDADAAEASADNRTIIVTGNTVESTARTLVSATPGGASVVGYEDYADKSLVSLRDALAFTPGVYLQPRYGQEVRISVRGSGISRGYHMRGLTLLQDGIPINLADDNGDFQELEPIFFDHLEVYRGSNALRFGSGTLGGAINGVTPTGRDAAGLYVRADVGTFETARGLVSYGGASDTVDYWLAVSADTSDGDRAHSSRHSQRFHGNVGIALSDTVTTRFYASANHIVQELPGALDLETVLTDPETGNFAGDQQRNIDSLRLQNRTTFDFGGTRLDVGAFYNRKSLFHPIYQVIDQESSDRGAFFRLDHGDGPLTLTVGGEWRYGTTDSERYMNVDGKRGTLTFDADQKARTASLYAEARYRPVPELSLIVGGVYADGFRRQHQTYNMGVSDVTGRAGFSAFSPKFALLLEPSESVQFYANYSRSAEMPGFGELAQQAAFVPIEAQTAWTAEIGSRGTQGAVSWDVSLYRSALHNEFLQYTVSSDIPASTFNADRTIHRGVEAALAVEFSPWLRLRQVYQLNDFRFDDDGQYGDNRLPVVPRHVYRAELRIGDETLNIAPNLEWVPQAPWADYANTLRADGYVLFGFTAGAKLTDRIDLFLDVRNLFQEKAAGDVSAAVAATAASAIFYPIERRAAFGGIRARF